MDALVERLETLLGEGAVLTGDAAKERGFSPWTRVGAPRAVARPRSTAEVSGILKLARAEGIAVVPWGGLTGLVSGAAAEGAVALSLEFGVLPLQFLLRSLRRVGAEFGVHGKRYLIGNE